MSCLWPAIRSAALGVGLLRALKEVSGWESHLVLTDAGVLNVWHEHKMKRKEVERLADFAYHPKDIAATIASGSFVTEGMVIAPCSMKSMGAIAHSLGGDLLVRGADVVLKERKKLVLVVRETPLHLGHLEAMASLTRMGAVIFPPVPAFYHRPKTLDDIINQTVTRILDQFDIDVKLFHRWDDEGMSRHPDAAKTTTLAAVKERRAAKKQR